MPDSITILNIAIRNLREQKLLQDLTSGFIVTPNVDHLITLQKDYEFYKAYQSAEWVICDSRILYFLSHLTRHPFHETISGSSFFSSFYNYHRDDPNCKIFLLGSKNDTSTIAMRRINEKVGREIVVGALSPSMGFDKKEDECLSIADTINQSGANVVVVGVGAPKQEKYIAKWRDKMPHVKIWMALGATIDFEAGIQRRAPKWIRKIGMEWFYRFIHEPRRLFKRYFVHDLKFFVLFAKQLTGRYRNPWEAAQNGTQQKNK